MCKLKKTMFRYGNISRIKVNNLACVFRMIGKPFVLTPSSSCWNVIIFCQLPPFDFFGEVHYQNPFHHHVNSS